jgi:polysaccharide export outer membrane protein
LAALQEGERCSPNIKLSDAMMRLMKVLSYVLALGMACVASTAYAQTPATDPGLSGAQGLNPGDQIRIVVWKNPQMSGDFAIAANGTITHPLYREIQVTGIPLSVVEDRIRTFLTKYETNPQFVIQPLVRVIVGGEVRTPNILSVPPETTIAQAVALAGGPTDRGLLDQVQLIRDRQVVKLDLSRPDSDVGILQVRSGDQIMIGRRGRSATEYLTPIISSIGAAAAIVTVFRR